MKINHIYAEDCLITMSKMQDAFIDLTVTSPPYDSLRDYKSYKFEFEKIAKELFRVTKPGGVVVWIVGDATIKGSETGTSFRQALYFKEIGFNLHDTMIYYRTSPYPSNVRYNQVFEYMFVLSKGKPKTFNKYVRQLKSSKNVYNINKTTYRDKHGEINYPDTACKRRRTLSRSKELKLGENIWYTPSGGFACCSDKIAFQHPATFPEKLAEDHILSWSNEKFSL